MKGGVILPPTGYIKVHAYTAFARIPIEDAAVTVAASDGTVIALKLTDRNGLIAPIPIPTPARQESLAPDPAEIPYVTANLYARKNGYEQIEAENLQIFPDTTTNLNLEFIPLSEMPGRWDQAEIFDTPSQNL